MNESEIVVNWALSFVQAHDAELNDALKRLQKKPRAAAPVHAVRKSLARFKATLEDFGSCLPLPDLYDLVAELHKKSGKIRDADVMLERIEAYFEGAEPDECDEMVSLHAELRSLRKSASKRLRRALQRSERRPRTIKGRVVPIDPELGANEALCRIVTVRSAEAFASSRDFARDKERLHAFRLATKRLRFALDRFALALPQFAGASEYLESLGDELGFAHDLLVLEQLAADRGAHALLARVATDRTAAIERAGMLWIAAIGPRGPLEALIGYAGFGTA